MSLEHTSSLSTLSSSPQHCCPPLSEDIREEETIIKNDDHHSDNNGVVDHHCTSTSQKSSSSSPPLREISSPSFRNRLNYFTDKTTRLNNHHSNNNSNNCNCNCTNNHHTNSNSNTNNNNNCNCNCIYNHHHRKNNNHTKRPLIKSTKKTKNNKPIDGLEEEGVVAPAAAPDKNSYIENEMLHLLSSGMNVKLLIGTLFLLATLQCIQSMTLYENILNVLLFTTQMINQFQWKTIDMSLSYEVEESKKKLDRIEKIRTIIGMIIFTIRMVYLPQHKMMFLPIMFIWFARANKLYIYSTFWGLFPTFYASFLYLFCACYFGYQEFMESGYTSAFIDLLSSYFILIGCVWMFTHYLVNVTGYLKHKVDKLQDTRQRLEGALEARSRFMAHISHEFRCPIMSSIGCLELLKDTPLNEKQNELVDTIVSSNSVLLLLIEDILQIVKIEHENKKAKKEEDLNIQTFNLFDSLKSMKGILIGYASNFKVNLNFDIDSRIKDMFIQSNASKLHQILSNLLTNAVKASKKDEEVWLKCRVLEENDDMVKIRFICQDNGCGIPHHLIGSIFEPFVQLKNTSQSKVPSTGLGLTTVSHLIKSLNGTISVQSQVGKGSTFTVDLPFKIVSKVKADRVKSGIAEDKRSKLHLKVHKNYLSLMSNLEQGEKEKEETSNFNSKIIIAEDNPINRKVIVKMINSMGYSTDFVCDGRELVENFNPKTHQIVITDMVSYFLNYTANNSLILIVNC